MLGGLRTIWRNVKLRDAAPWSMFVSSNWSGKPVTPTSAMENATFWACVRMTAQTIGTLPLFLYRKDGKDGRDVATDHPLYPLLHDQPNAEQTATEFVEGMVVCLCLWGNAYVEKVYSGPRIVAMNLLRPDLMEVSRDRQTDEIVYRYSDPRGATEFTPGQVMHVRGFGMGGDEGLSVLSFARQSLGAAMVTDETAARTFANGLRPSGWLVYKNGNLSKDNRDALRESLQTRLSGPENAGKVGILESGFEWIAADLPPKDAEMLASRAWNVEEICRWFNMPPILVGHASQGQTMWGTGVTAIVLGWHVLGLRPLLIRIEQAMKRSLLRPEERAEYYAEFSVEGLLRADPAARAEMYSKLIGVAGITPNQICGLENWPRFDGGDVHLVNSTLVPVDQAGRRPGRVPPAPGEPIPEAVE